MAVGDQGESREEPCHDLIATRGELLRIEQELRRLRGQLVSDVEHVRDEHDVHLPFADRHIDVAERGGVRGYAGRGQDGPHDRQRQPAHGGRS